MIAASAEGYEPQARGSGASDRVTRADAGAAVELCSVHSVRVRCPGGYTVEVRWVYTLVVVVEAIVLAALWALGRHFS